MSDIKIKSPKINIIRDIKLDDHESNLFYENTRFIGSPKDEIFFEEQDIKSCIFENVDFTKIKFDKIDFTDVIFINCNLSNIKFDGMYFSKVAFINTKMTGTSFIDASLKDVVFDNVISKYLNFSGSRMNNVSIKSSHMVESYFTYANIDKLAIYESNLSKSEFINIKLIDVDFSTSDITGCRFDLESLKGIKISLMQAPGILNMLGIHINN